MSTYSIYTGFWINWKDGSMVLTITQRDGLILIAFLVLVTSVAMGQLWSILCFVVHQFRSTRSPRSGLYQQQQAVLRNTATSAGVLILLVKTAWAWKSKRIDALRQSSPLIALAALHVAFLAFSTIFSSKVVIAGDEVLLRAGVCGWINGPGTLAFRRLNNTEKMDSNLADYRVGRHLATQSRIYAQTCYNTVSAMVPDECKTYTAPRIPFITSSVPCPFSKEICALPEATQIDTGYIDSSEHFGINTRPEFRVRLRKLLTCVPLLAEEHFSSNWTSSPLTTLSGDTSRFYFLGPFTTGHNFTWAVSNYTYWSRSDPAAYTLGAATTFSHHYDDLNASDFSPIPAVRVDKADLTLVFQTSMAGYLQPVNDPWFRATSPVHQTGFKLAFDGLWYADRAASVLGCTEQYQFCNTTQCSPLDGTDPEFASHLFPTNQQKAIYEVLLRARSHTKLGLAIVMLDNSILLAHDNLIAGARGVSAALPDDQWRTEVTNFAAVTLAALQRRIINFVAPPDIPIRTAMNGTVGAAAFVRAVADDMGGSLCGSVRIRDARFHNFSVVGVTLILALGVFVTAINVLCIPGAVFSVRRRLRLGDQFAEREWREGGLLRLQRTAFETHDVRPWEANKNGDVPITIDQRLTFSTERMWTVGGKVCGSSFSFRSSHQDREKPMGGKASEGDTTAEPLHVVSP